MGAQGGEAGGVRQWGWLNVVDALERVEQLLEEGETGPAQDSLSWQRAGDDADIQLGKACAMLGTCRQLRQGTNNYVSIVELSFNAIERSFQFYLVEMTAADSADYRKHEEVFDDIAARNVFSDEEVAGRIDAFRAEHRSRFYYDIDRPGRDFAVAMHDLAEEVHRYLVEFADAHSRCNCDRRE